MKHFVLIAFFLLVAFFSNATVVTINNSGLTFSPANVTINLGDTINFVISTSHDAKEVSQATYNSNGNTALAGGFQTAFGGGIVLPTQLTLGTHYYVCTPHASVGMKGTINVVSTTGVNFSSLLLGSPEVYPNPAKNNFMVSFQLAKSAAVKVLLFGLDGRLVINEEISNAVAGEFTKAINLEGVKTVSGIYLLEVIVDDKVFRNRIVIE